MDWAQILVIILAIVLVIFLLLASALVVLLLKITKQIKSITSTAERTVQQFEKSASNLSKFSSPMMLARLVKGKLSKRKKTSKKK